MKLLLLDKDGTLVVPRYGNFPQHPKDQILIPGVRSAIDRYVADGWTPVIVSNQGGISAKPKPHKTVDDTIAEMRYAMQLCGHIKTAYFCPDFEGDELYIVSASDATCRSRYHAEFEGYPSFRKPNPGMLIAAIKAHGATETLMVGDRSEDAEAAAKAGVSFVWAKEWAK